MPEELCFEQSRLDLNGTMYFIGTLASTLIFLPLADVLGRKRLIITGMLAHAGVQLLYFALTPFVFSLAMLLHGFESLLYC